MAHEDDNVIKFPNVSRAPREIGTEFVKLVQLLDDREDLSPGLRAWFEPENKKELNEAYFDFADVYHEMLVSPEIGSLDDGEALERWTAEQEVDPVGTMQSVIAMGLYKRRLVSEGEEEGMTLDAAKVDMDRRLHGVREDRTHDPIALSETLAFVEQIREQEFGQ